MTAPLSNVQILNRLIVLADKIMARANTAIDLVDDLRAVSAEVERGFRRPSDDIRVIAEAEQILVMALLHLALGRCTAIDRDRYRVIADTALAVTRDHLFVAIDQQNRATP